MKSWIVYNGNLKDDFLDRFILWMDQAAKNVGFENIMVKNSELLCCIQNNKSTIKGKYENNFPDFVLFWDKDIRLAEHLESMNIPVFNSSSAIEYCDNKALTYQKLMNHNVLMPKTIFSPFTFSNMNAADLDYLFYVERELGFPMIVKEVYGSYGEQVHLVHSRDELLTIVRKMNNTPHIYQEMISSSFGRDLRLYVVGDEVKSAMLRTSKGDFRANTSLGGVMDVFVPTIEQKELAIKTSKLLGLDFSGVDLLFGENGKMYVCEVNSNATMIDFSKLAGIHLGEEIFKYIKTKIES